ncbi:right-handed parallel beta-helix repeat-containing protein [Dankookia sp. P2]|uniref:right-handed parallel beta-helix repeat-containing protein n=1 Tax=Dankookia sp. P2 TaxID=3423955 RepID=UPI003D66C326
MGFLLGGRMIASTARAESRTADAPLLGRQQGASGRDPQRGVVPASVGGMTGAQDAALRAIIRNSGRTGVAAVPPPGAIPIAAGAKIQDAVDAQPPGTAFILAAGRFVGQTVSPKSGNRFYGSVASGDTILEGAGAARAFQGQGIADVLLSGLVFADWATPNESTGVLGTDGSARGWKVENCTFRHNRIGPPVMLGAGMRVVNCHFHHNEASGIGAWKIHDAEIDHCEFNHNNQKREWPFTATGSVAGIKLAWTTRSPLHQQPHSRQHQHGRLLVGRKLQRQPYFGQLD